MPWGSMRTDSISLLAEGMIDGADIGRWEGREQKRAEGERA